MGSCFARGRLLLLPRVVLFTSECLLLVAFDVRLMSHLLMHDVQRADRIADSVSLTLAVHIVLLVCKNQLRFVSSMTFLMTLNPEVA